MDPGKPEKPGKPHKPTDPARPADPPPGSTVAMTLSLSSPVASPGGRLTATAHVRSGKKTAKDVRLMITSSGFTVGSCSISAACGLGSVGHGGESVSVTLNVPSNAQPGSHITVYGTVTAAQSNPQTAGVSFGVTDGSAATILPSSFPGGSFDPLSGSGPPRSCCPPWSPPRSPRAP